MIFDNSVQEGKINSESENHHHTSQFYIRMFSCNPKASKSKQEVFYLTKTKRIFRDRIKRICVYPGYYTEAQETILSRMENDLAPALRRVVMGQNDSNDIFLMKELAALLVAGSLKFRKNYAETEKMLTSKILGKVHKDFGLDYKDDDLRHANPISGRFNQTLLCAEKLYEEVENYHSLLLRANEDVFITSDSPVLLYTCGNNAEELEYIMDISEARPQSVRNTVTGELEVTLSTQIKRIRIPSGVIYFPLSRNTLLILFDVTMFPSERLKLCSNKMEVNHLNAHIFGQCDRYAFASSERLLQQCAGIMSHTSLCNPKMTFVLQKDSYLT